MKRQFTRKETINLTLSTSNQLQYLERVDLIVPTKIWDGKIKPEVYYTWNQVLEIRAIREMRTTTTLRLIRKIITSFQEYHCDKELRKQRIVVVGNNLLWIQSDWSDFPEKMSQYGNITGWHNLLIVPMFDDVVNDVLKNAKQFNINVENNEQSLVAV